ncbi:MAG: hypothetical protein ACLRUB_01195 [Streptococcus sp.]
MTIKPLNNLKVLAKFGDTVTTDHISQLVILLETVQQTLFV